jgi:tol-pal system protein YbgF
MQIKVIAGSLPVLLAAAMPVLAQQQGYGGYEAAGYGAETLDERVAKLEKRLSGSGLAELSQQIERLQREVAKLRGQFEELDHKVESLKIQQQSLYTDLEQRIQQGTGPAGTTAEVPASAGSDVVAGSEPAPPAKAPETRAPAPSPSRAGVAVSDGAAREAAYQKAFTTLKEGRYTEAVKEFKNFTVRYPSGDYADNAQYWLGEAYYVNRDFTAAREAFQKLIDKFPQSPKVPDAYLKLAYIEYDTGKTANAKQLLNDVIKRYPGSTAAKQAEKRLQKLQQTK